MHGFEYENNELVSDGVPLKKLAEEFGTPLYVYSRSVLNERIRLIKNSLGRIGKIFYAVKANNNPHILSIIAQAGFGADTVSIGETQIALKAGFAPENIAFSGVGKRKDELQFAIEKGIFINAESIEEIALIASIRQGVRIGIRLNPEISVPTHKYITTGSRLNKFGIPFERAVYAFKFARNSGLVPEAIHVHIGSQIIKLKPYYETIKKVLSLRDKLRMKRIEIKKIDLGGGFGISYKDEKEFPVEEFAKHVEKLKEEEIEFAFEPGRFIVGPSGALLTRVLYRKFCMKKFVIVDAGMNDFIRPALYGAYHRAANCIRRGSKTIVCDIVGPVCESGDFLALRRKIERPEQGDCIAIMDAGAYGFSMASNYNLRPKPAEVIVENGKAFVIREREKFNF